MTLSHREIFERYIHAGALTRNPDAVAALFTEDGVYEAPLVPDGHRLPRRLAGREAIRAGVGAYHREFTNPGPVDLAASRYTLHDTADSDVFVCEIDTVFDGPGDSRTTISLVQIFRVRDGRICLLRDYFAVPAG